MKSELKISLALAGIFAFRMFGLFMILPTFAIYAQPLHGATPALIGLALGVYGLTQALFQIPMGMLSDRVGRHPVIAAGLLLFVGGSILAALSHSIYGIILGRALQGSGAVGSTLLALVADLTSPKNRTKAMATIGMAIGLSVMIALALGPVLSSWMGISGIFWVTAIMGGVGILILTTIVPKPKPTKQNQDRPSIRHTLKATFANRELARLNYGIGSLHAIFTASFIALPLCLRYDANVPTEHQWLIYLPALVLAFIIMIPFIIYAEKKQQMKPTLLFAIGLVGAAQLYLLFNHQTAATLFFGLLLFFVAFTLLESSLPSLVSKTAPTKNKGAAMGIYSSAQFLGIFLGGSLGGIIFSHYQKHGIFLFCATLAILWFGIATTMKNPSHQNVEENDTAVWDSN